MDRLLDRFRRKSRTGAGLLLLWAVLVSALFVWRSTELVGSVAGCLATLGKLALSIYSFWFLGFRLFRRFAQEADPLERSVIEFGLGTATVSLAVFFGGVLGAYQPVWILLAWALVLIGPHRSFLRSLAQNWERLRGAPFDLVAVGALTIVGLLTLFLALAPSTSQDALVYHLAIPAQYVAAGGIEYIPGNFFAQFPQNIEMLFTLGLLVGDDALAKCYHWTLGAAATAAVAALCRTAHARASGVVAAAIFATIPTAALIAGWAYVDLGVVFFTTLSTLCFVRFLKAEHTRYLVLAAIFAGAAAGSKYTAGLQGLLLVGGVVISGRLEHRPTRRVIRDVVLTAGLVGLVACPWWIKNFIYTGNPIFPFAYGLLGGDNWDPQRSQVLAEALAQWGGQRDTLGTLLLPWRVSLSGQFFSIEHFDGVIGCIFLAAAPLLLLSSSLSLTSTVIFTFLVVEAVFWSLMTHQVRFLLPGLALAAALIGAAFPTVIAVGWPRRVARGLLNVTLAFNVLIVAVYFAAHNPLAVVLGVEGRTQYLSREVAGGDYPIFAFIEERLPDDSYILFGSLGNPGFLCKRDYHADAFFENHTLRILLREAQDADALLRAFEAAGYTHFLFRWENVLDPEMRKSDLELEEQQRLVEFLNVHAKLLAQMAGTHLFEIGRSLGPQTTQ